MTADTIVTWLLEPSDPSIRYRTLTDLLGQSRKDPEVVAACNCIPQSVAVVQLLEKMHPEGYWLQTNPRTHRTLGDGTEYGSFGTTHFCLAYLAELGLDRSHPRIAFAAERYLGLQQPDGDWFKHLSCLYGYNIRTFIMLGYRADHRLKRSIQLLEESVRPDGGYLCDLHEPGTPGRKARSCIRGSLKALSAYAELGPAYWNHPSCLKVVDYFLERGGIYTRKAPQELVNNDVHTMMFPFHWRATLVEVLYYLSKMGHGKDPRLHRAWNLLQSKVDDEGRYVLERKLNQNVWNIGKIGSANKWMTLYSLLAIKAAEGEQRGGRKTTKA